MVIMRAAVPSDSEAIAELEALLFDNSMGARMVRQELRLGAGWVEERGSLLGYILTRVEEGILDITRLGVHPDAQHQGVGSALLLKGMGDADVVILTVQKDNLAAIKLYFKHGFEIVGHLHAAKAWVMRHCKKQD
jgi:ribosomal protein S18 acetylase RimI-like enzyme